MRHVRRICGSDMKIRDPNSSMTESIPFCQWYHPTSGFWQDGFQSIVICDQQLEGNGVFLIEGAPCSFTSRGEVYAVTVVMSAAFPCPEPLQMNRTPLPTKIGTFSLVDGTMMFCSNRRYATRGVPDANSLIVWIDKSSRRIARSLEADVGWMKSIGYMMYNPGAFSRKIGDRHIWVLRQMNGVNMLVIEAGRVDIYNIHDSHGEACSFRRKVAVFERDSGAIPWSEIRPESIDLAVMDDGCSRLTKTRGRDGYRY